MTFSKILTIPFALPLALALAACANQIAGIQAGKQQLEVDQSSERG